MKQWIQLLSSVSLALSITPGTAAGEPSQMDPVPPALEFDTDIDLKGCSWVWLEDNAADSAPSGERYFRKRMTVPADHKIKSARFVISADNQFVLMVNGDKAGEGSEWGCPVDVNITKYIRPGKNQFAILATNAGDEPSPAGLIGRYAISYESGAEETGCIDTSWLAGDRNPPGWEQVDYDDSAWRPAKVVAELGGGPWGGMPTSAPRALKDYGLREYVYLTKTLPHSENNAWTLVCKLPYNAQFQPWIEVEAPAGRTILMDSTNPLVPSQQPAQEYPTKSGIQSYEAPNWISGEGARYTIPAGVTVRSVRFRETGVDTEFAGSFSCNDSDYNLLWQKATRTCYLCMRDHFMDCPDRERSEWLGDAVLQMEESFYAFDTRSHVMARNLILSKQFNGLQGQDLIAHGEFGEWTYFMYTGDRATISAIYSSTKEYLDKYEFDESGLPIHRGDGWDWYDWGVGTTDKEVIQVAEYFTAIKALKKMAGVTGHAGDIAAIDVKLDSIMANFDKVFWKGNGYRSGHNPDERANAMAVVAGLADKSRWPTIGALLKKKGECGPYFERWVLEALCIMRMPEQALLRMHDRYKVQIQSDFSTLSEYMERSFENTAPNSTDSDEYLTLNHAWNTPNVILSRFIAGVAPETSGWSTYHVLPQEAFLTTVKVVVPSVKGTIRVNLQKTEKQYKLDLSSPADTSAIVGIPKVAFKSLKDISVNGNKVWDGTYAQTVSGVSWNGEDLNYVKFNVTPGIWSFVASGSLTSTSPKEAPQRSTDLKLNKKSWSVSAFADQQSYKGGPWGGRSWSIDASAVNAIDEDPWTGWRAIDPQKPLSAAGQYSGQQTPGQWLMVDLKKARTFHKVILDNTWAPYDFPKSYEVYASNDTANWGLPVATGAGELGLTTIVFPQTTARYLKIVQTGTKDKPWSVFELNIFTH